MASVRLAVDRHTLTTELADNPTARDLVDRLPQTLTFRHFKRVEKLANLPRPLTNEPAWRPPPPQVVVGRHSDPGGVARGHQDRGPTDRRTGWSASAGSR
jgi:hypothetical protein